MRWCVFYVLLLLSASCSAGFVTDSTVQELGYRGSVAFAEKSTQLTSEKYKLNITFPISMQATKLVSPEYTLVVK